MSMVRKRAAFLDSVEGAEIARTLKQMSTDERYNTKPSYSANTDVYPNNLIPFVDKHMAYLSTHPSTNPEHYIANLRLMTRLR
jgi:hypothetical protein